MVDVLIRMKLTIIRHSMTGGRATWMITGAVLGVAGAGVTIWLSLLDPANPRVTPDLLAAAYLVWMLGWVVGPLWSGAPVLRADHFTLLPVPRRQLAVGLLATAFVAITAAVTFLAFVSLVVYGARLGLGPALVAVPGLLLQLVVVVLVSRVAAAGFGVLAASRTGAVLTGAVSGVMLVLAQAGWMLYLVIEVSGVLVTGFGPGFRTTVRAIPSGWALVAVESADSGRWWLTAVTLVGLLVFAALLLVVWGYSLGMARRARVTIRGSRAGRPASGGVFGGSAGAVLRKELRTWWRDPLRVQNVVLAVVCALGTVLLPLAFHSKALLPWAGPSLALLAGTAACNLYGQDGTALWLTLQTRSERADLRGRQLAYLLVFGPITVLAAVGFLFWSGMYWTWPWVAALTPALLGGGAGLVAVCWVVALAPGPDAHKRPENPLEHADTTGPANVMVWSGLLPAAPAATLLGFGTYYDLDLLLWLAIPVGVVTGAVMAFWLGRVAADSLRARGPELLLLMRTGRPSTPVKTEAAKRNSWVAAVFLPVGAIAMFPQGIVPMVFMLAGIKAKVWFLALYLPGPLRWPVALLMVLIGVWCYYLVLRSGIRTKTGADASGLGTATPADAREVTASTSV